MKGPVSTPSDIAQATRELVLAVEKMSPSGMETFSKIFHNFAVGISAAVATIGGLRALTNLRTVKKVSWYKKKYPLSKLNKKRGFRVVKMKTDDKWWLLDLKTKTKYWLRNPQTTEALGFRKVITPEEVTQSELNKFETGGVIKLREP